MVPGFYGHKDDWEGGGPAARGGFLKILYETLTGGG